jgi:hypothetical protein
MEPASESKIHVLGLKLTPEQQKQLQDFTGLKATSLVVTRVSQGGFRAVNIGVACW